MRTPATGPAPACGLSGPHGSTAGRAAYLALADDVLLGQCAMDRFRASGPGGQKRNKTDSAVRLRHLPTGLTGEAHESRSQHENRARALRRLRRAIALGVREPVDLNAYVLTPMLRAALDGPLPGLRTVVFLAAIGEVFDVCEATAWRVSTAARMLGVSTAALGRLLAADPAVLRAASERRQALGLRPLRPRDG